MKKLLVFTIVFLIGSSMIAQFDLSRYSISIQKIKFKESRAFEKKLNLELQKKLSHNLNVANLSNIRLIPKLNMTKTYLIEGMESKKVGTPQLEFSIINTFTNEKDIYVYKKKVVEESTKLMGEVIVNSFVNDDAEMDLLLQFVENFLDSQYGNMIDCDEQVHKIQDIIAQKDYNKALRLLLNLRPSSCHDMAEKLQEEILIKQMEDICSTKLFDAEIMIQSGVFFQMKNAIPILLSISPKAPCANRALELSKLIGEKMDSSGRTSELNNYIEYFNGQEEKWKIDYYNRLMRKR